MKCIICNKEIDQDRLITQSDVDKELQDIYFHIECYKTTRKTKKGWKIEKT